MTLRTPRLPTSLLAVRALVPLALLSLITAPIPAARAQNQLWITQFGTSEHENLGTLVSDSAGGLFVAGDTRGSLGGPNLGGGDAFLARYDETGKRIWIRQFGTSEPDRANALASDGAGGVFVAGYTWGNLGGPTAGSGDVFLARFDSVGNQLWIRQFGTRASDKAWALAPDGAGGVMVAGNAGGSLGGPYLGLGDVFLARYDEAGNQLWIRQFGTIWYDEVRALASDGSGGVMVAGGTYGSLAGPNAGEGDAFLARYDETGTQLWIRQFGTSGTDRAFGLTPDGAGGAIVAGSTRGILGGSASGSTDAFVGRFDSAGNQLWIRQFGTRGIDSAGALSPDGAGGVIVGGGTTDSLGGPSAGGSDAYLARFDGAGNRLWLHQFGSSRSEWIMGLAPDGAGGVLCTGYTYGSLGGPNAGGQDVFLARFTIDFCYADCDHSGALDIFDFLCFQNSFVSGEPYACDCDPDPVCDIFDFLCFQNAFVAGCP